MSFEALNIKPEIVRALAEQSITEPTAIQEKAIPLIKEGKDVIGISKTGSGKTIAFSVPIIEKLVPGAGVQALIVVPTRELSVQIAQEVKKFSKYLRCSVATVFGGVSIMPQMERIAHADIVVGTPGRLLDHLQRNTLDLSKLRCAVLDEADKMVEMGFIEDIENILDCTPQGRQVLLFGATLSDEIERLQRRYMSQPVTAEAERHVQAELLKQYYYTVPHHEKFSLLAHLLRKPEVERAMVFCSTRTTVELVARNLHSQGIQAEMIHGKLSQNRRLRALENFHRGIPKILVASAVAARGLDVKDISHVFNYDLSRDPQEYVHRIGRTARAGEEGKAVTLLADRDYQAFSDILNTHRLQVEELPLESFPRLRFDARSAFGSGQSERGGFRGGFRGRESSGGSGSRGFGGGYRDREQGRGRFGQSQRPYGREQRSWGRPSPSPSPQNKEGGGWADWS